MTTNLVVPLWAKEGIGVEIKKAFNQLRRRHGTTQQRINGPALFPWCMLVQSITKTLLIKEDNVEVRKFVLFSISSLVQTSRKPYPKQEKCQETNRCYQFKNMMEKNVFECDCQPSIVERGDFVLFILSVISMKNWGWDHTFFASTFGHSRLTDTNVDAEDNNFSRWDIAISMSGIQLNPLLSQNRTWTLPREG